MCRLDRHLTPHQWRFCVYHECAQPGCDDPSAAAEKHEQLDVKSRFYVQQTPIDLPPLEQVMKFRRYTCLD
ncbi:hypothetical protein PG996_001320 [Apiospora saccharicola]|uniref:Uncharacterized protein n=1 Tax=Apiospora saccharicola TaxID=335842 RepID=A0ABR1WGA5_9PEZI